MPENPGFTIPTRQKSDVLFSILTPLGAASSVTTETRRVLGYDSISILAISDRPFTISVREACEDQVFVQTDNMSSAVVSGKSQVCARIAPCGAFMLFLVANPGIAMTFFDLCGQGIPQP